MMEEYQKIETRGEGKEKQNVKDSKYLKYLKYLKYIFSKYSWLWLLVLFILPLGVGWIAYDLLTYSGGNGLPEPSLGNGIFPEKTITETSENTNMNSMSNMNVDSGGSQELPLWLMLAIAFCCGSGCLVILIILRSSPPIRKTSKTVGRKK